MEYEQIQKIGDTKKERELIRKFLHFASDNGAELMTKIGDFYKYADFDDLFEGFIGIDKQKLAEEEACLLGGTK